MRIALAYSVLTLPWVVAALVTHPPRSCRRSLAWLGDLLRWERPTSPELAQAGLLFRLQRHGVAGPRLLAVGQRQQGTGCTGSFLLTETPTDAVPLLDWLPTAAHAGRRDALRQSPACCAACTTPLVVCTMSRPWPWAPRGLPPCWPPSRRSTAPRNRGSGWRRATCGTYSTKARAFVAIRSGCAFCWITWEKRG